jgi:hypothetical protein
MAGSKENSTKGREETVIDTLVGRIDETSLADSSQIEFPAAQAT